MFGRMFPTLPPLKVSDAKLEALADAMIDTNPGAATGNNPNIPAGFTYFGQFVDHDITLDLTSLGDKEKDPLGIENFRTPSVDLDCVYGLGPDGSPHLYARNPAAGNKHGPKLLIGKNINTGERRLPQRPAAQPGRLRADRRPSQRREPAGRADASRDAEVPQRGLRHAVERPQPAAGHLRRGAPDRHLALPVDRAARLGRAADREGHRREDPARRAQVLPLQEDPLHAGRVLGRGLPPRPLMVRQRYRHNRVFTRPPDFSLFFTFAGLSGDIIGDLAPSPPTAPTPCRCFQQLDHRLAALLRTRPERRRCRHRSTPSRKLDPYLVASLHNLPGGGGNLAFRNLKRGVNLGLPSGQDVAKHMKVKNPLTPDEIASDSNGSTDGAVAKAQGLHTATPLWYYILKEAKVRHDGERLGPVGSTIISEVFVGLVHGDHNSFLWQVKNWKPTLPSAKAGRLHHGGPAPLRERHQSARRLTEAAAARGDDPRAFPESKESRGRPRPEYENIKRTAFVAVDDRMFPGRRQPRGGKVRATHNTQGAAPWLAASTRSSWSAISAAIRKFGS